MDKELYEMCGEPTGRAGRGEDSLYCGDIGPLCEEYWPEQGWVEAEMTRLDARCVTEKHKRLRAEARADRLEAALRPFAQQADEYDDGFGEPDPDFPDDQKIDDLGVADITVGHCRDARKALKGEER